jgi:hypothetical protein
MGRREIGKLITLLGADVSSQYQQLLSEDSQLLRRSFIRSFFAYVEGATYLLKQSRLSHASQHSAEYTAAEMAMLAEENYSLNNKGEISTQRKFLPTAENFLFAMRIFLKGIPNVDLGIDVGSVEWGNFKKALQIRHRIVHPKSESDVEISDSEKELLVHVCVWFNYVVVSMLIDCVDSLNITTKQLKRETEQLKKGAEQLKKMLPPSST